MEGIVTHHCGTSKEVIENVDSHNEPKKIDSSELIESGAYGEPFKEYKVKCRNRKKMLLMMTQKDCTANSSKENANHSTDIKNTIDSLVQLCDEMNYGDPNLFHLSSHSRVVFGNTNENNTQEDTSSTSNSSTGVAAYPMCIDEHASAKVETHNDNNSNEVVADPKSSSGHVCEAVDIGEHESMSATTAESQDSDYEYVIQRRSKKKKHRSKSVFTFCTFFSLYTVSYIIEYWYTLSLLTKNNLLFI